MTGTFPATRRSLWRRRCIVFALTVVGAVPFLTPAEASASFKITLVARQCPTYQDVMANRARNDIQESLRDLGKNTVYRQDGSQPISPTVEEANNPRCTPITGWEFKFGDGINGGDSGPWGFLSKVAHPITHPSSLVTLAHTALLNSVGIPTKKNIEGAVTTDLTDAEAALAGRSSLWVQGGVPGDPVLTAKFPDTYGFAALRCAIDNLNGDNVEFVRYPTGTTHVFCYAYYVTPPPTKGVIVIRKQVDVDAPQSYTQNFRFVSNITYNASGDFLLAVTNNAAASKTFIRAETTPDDPPWEVTEDVPAGWQLQSLVCTTLTGLSTTTISGAKATIHLFAGDTVTCTYTDERDAGGPLVVAKQTIGAVGTFAFAAGLAGTTPTRHRITTTAAGDPAAWTTPFTKAGTYVIGERLPSSSAGRWRLRSVSCDGVPKPRRRVITHTMLRSSGGSLCTFTNVFTPNGAITVRGITLGGTARIEWLVGGPARQPAQFAKRAQTSTPGEPETASGASTSHLPLGMYAITQTSVVGGGLPWELIDIACDGGIVPGRVPGGVAIALTRQHLHVTCTFTNQVLPEPNPPIPTIPPEPPPGGGGVPIPEPGPTPPAHTVRLPSRTLPLGAVQTGFGRGRGVPSVWRPGSPDRDLLQEAGDATTPTPRANRGARSRVDAMTVRVPRLGILGRLQRLDLAPGRRLRVPADPRRVGWWSGGAFPGAPGSTVLAGHVDGPAGPAVFNRLSHARRGDVIYISLPAGRPLRYRVTAVREYAKGRMPRRLVFGSSSRNRLRLVTCGGAFNNAIGSYDDNIVVYARLG